MSDTPVWKNAYYTCWLPVWKQGTDLGGHLESEATVPEAFEALAQQYEAAAADCRRMAGIATEVPEMTVDADTHHIGVSGPVERLDLYAREGSPLQKDEHFDEERGGEDEVFDFLCGQEKPFTAEEAIALLQQEDFFSDVNPQWVREALEKQAQDGALFILEGSKYRTVTNEEV